MEKRIKKHYKKEIEISELDFVLFDELGLSDEEMENRGRTIVTEDKSEYTKYYMEESSPINIDTLVTMLNELKEIGSTHVEIVHHGDHIGYVLNGLQISLATKNELKDLKDAEKASGEKEKKAVIKALEATLKELKE